MAKPLAARPLAQDTRTHHQQLQICALCGVLNETGEEKTHTRHSGAGLSAAGLLTRSTSVFKFWVTGSSVSQADLELLHNAGMSGVHL